MDYFKQKMEFYLGDICNILNYCLNDNEFQLLVKLKSRPNFEELFIKKKKAEIPSEDIPHSTYIFSQQMANLQVSLVKKINFKFKRTGTLIASRFKRELISSQAMLNECIHRMNEGKKVHSYSSFWKNRTLKAKSIETGSWIYKSKDESRMGFGCYLNGFNLDLVDTFNKLPPLNLNTSKKYSFSSFFKFNTIKIQE
jgi:hypothetical protein